VNRKIVKYSEMNEEIPTIVHTSILRCICVRFDCTFAMFFFYYAHVVIWRMRQTCLHSINTCMCMYVHVDTVSTAPVKPQERQRHGLGNTRARRTNTANRASNMLMHHRHVLVPVCAISILWNFRTNPYHSSETTS